MNFIADLHLHSKYSRATSPRMDLPNLSKWAQIKGIKLLGTADFTHPQWLEILKQELEPAEPGLFKIKKDPSDPIRFLLTTEVSCIYSKEGKVRKIHLVILAPNFKDVEEINTRLGWVGNLKSDGRPILKMDAKELTKIVLDSSEDCLIIPAHMWTPWFSLFGSRSGFNSLQECFGDYSKYIYAGETGLSSDPKMNWRLSALDRVTLVSNSDAHSPSNIGREANIFEGENLSYNGIVEAIKADPSRISSLNLVSTLEFYPQEGKYHYDGHRKCGVRLSPQESEKYNNICPVCGKPLTIGVLSRVEELADRPSGFKPSRALPFKSLIPLAEIIGEALGQNPDTKKVKQEYHNLIEKFGSEFEVLLDISYPDLKSSTFPEVFEGIKRVREEKVHIKPGYDGVYGKVSIFSKEEERDISSQKTLF